MMDERMMDIDNQQRNQYTQYKVGKGGGYHEIIFHRFVYRINTGGY